MQTHLNRNDTINLGSYYTPTKLINLTYALLKKHLKEHFDEYTLLDNSCGYGEFLNVDTLNKKIAGDIDEVALAKVKINQKYIVNALNGANRGSYGISANEKLIIIGNPPYNDTTSQIRKNLKRKEFLVDDELQSRDIGISFLRSYVRLLPDYICILHPLSYLIKQANFNLLKSFKDQYKLVDNLVVSSKYFTKGMEFPIAIALYEKGSMDFKYINDFTFKTENGSSFKLKNFDFIGNYLNKYPRKTVKELAGYFYTMRDINALKRNKTFLKEKCANAIPIERGQLPYYHYVNLFKTYANNIPFWLGNLDVFIDNDFFRKHVNDFIKSSESGKLSKLVDDYFQRITKQT